MFLIIHKPDWREALTLEEESPASLGETGLDINWMAVNR